MEKFQDIMTLHYYAAQSPGEPPHMDHLSYVECDVKVLGGQVPLIA